MGLNNSSVIWPGADVSIASGKPWSRVVGGMAIKYPSPDFKIIADSKDVTQTISDRLLSMVITTISGRKSDTLEIRLDDGDGIETPRIGVSLDVSLGYKKAIEKMGTFIVDEVEVASPPATMTIRAKAGDMTGRLKSCQKRIWDNKTIGEIVSAIAAEHGYIAKVSDTLASSNPGYLVQFYESDFNFLTRLSREIENTVFKPVNGYLAFIYRNEVKSISGKELLTVGITPGEVTSWRATNAGRNRYARVITRYRDLEAAQDVAVEAGTGEPSVCDRRLYKDLISAEKAAVAKLKYLSRKTQALSLVMPGNPILAAETKLLLNGFRSGVDGEWTTKQAIHKVTKNGGYATSIEAQIKT